MRSKSLSLFISVYAVFGFTSGIISVVAPYIYEISEVRFSEYGYASFLSMLLSAILIIYVTKFESKVVGLMFSILIVCSWILMSTLSKYLVLIARFVSYVSFMLVNIVVIESIFQAVEKYRATLLGFLNMLSFALSLASPPVAVVLMSLLSLDKIALIIALLYTPLLLIIQRIAVEKTEEEGVSFREIYHKHRYAFLFVAITSLAALPSSMYVLFDKIIGVYIGDFPPWVIGAYDVLESILVAVLMPVGGYIVDKLGLLRWVVSAICDGLNIPYALGIIYGAVLRDPFLYLSATIPDALLASFSQASIALLGDFKAPTKHLIALNQGLSEIVAGVSILLSGIILDTMGSNTLLIIIVTLSIIFVFLDITLVKQIYVRGRVIK